MVRCKLILKSFRSRNKDLLIKAFITYVRPILEFCSFVWSPYDNSLIHKIKKVQRYFTKHIPRMWHKTYEERLEILKLQSLEARRTMHDMSLCYQLINGHIHSSLSSLLSRRENTKARGHNFRLKPHPFNKDIMKYLFINRIVKVWNKLPSDTVNATAINSFKRKICSVDLIGLLNKPC